MSRFIFVTFIFLACVVMSHGCSASGGHGDKSKGKSGRGRTTRWRREGDSSLIAKESKLGMIQRLRNRHARTETIPKDSELLEEIFGTIDTNGNGIADAGKWVNFSERISIRDFVKLLGSKVVNVKLRKSRQTTIHGTDGEPVSLEEFQSSDVLKIYQSDDRSEDEITSR